MQSGNIDSQGTSASLKGQGKGAQGAPPKGQGKGPPPPTKGEGKGPPSKGHGKGSVSVRYADKQKMMAQNSLIQKLAETRMRMLNLKTEMNSRHVNIKTEASNKMSSLVSEEAALTNDIARITSPLASLLWAVMAKWCMPIETDAMLESIVEVVTELVNCVNKSVSYEVCFEGLQNRNKLLHTTPTLVSVTQNQRAVPDLKDAYGEYSEAISSISDRESTLIDILSILKKGISLKTLPTDGFKPVNVISVVKGVGGVCMKDGMPRLTKPYVFKMLETLLNAAVDEKIKTMQKDRLREAQRSIAADKKKSEKTTASVPKSLNKFGIFLKNAGIDDNKIKKDFEIFRNRFERLVIGNRIPLFFSVLVGVERFLCCCHLGKSANLAKRIHEAKLLEDKEQNVLLLNEKNTNDTTIEKLIDFRNKRKDLQKKMKGYPLQEPWEEVFEVLSLFRLLICAIVNEAINKANKKKALFHNLSCSAEIPETILQETHKETLVENLFDFFRAGLVPAARLQQYWMSMVGNEPGKATSSPFEFLVAMQDLDLGALAQSLQAAQRLLELSQCSNTEGCIHEECDIEVSHEPMRRNASREKPQRKDRHHHDRSLSPLRREVATYLAEGASKEDDSQTPEVSTAIDSDSETSLSSSSETTPERGRVAHRKVKSWQTPVANAPSFWRPSPEDSVRHGQELDWANRHHVFGDIEKRTRRMPSSSPLRSKRARR